jgi:SnoaL-like domain
VPVSPQAESGTSSANELAARRFWDAMRAGDAAGLRGLLAPGVVLNSPITDRFQFRGRERVVELYEVVHAPLRDLEHCGLMSHSESVAQVSRARVGRQAMTVTQLIEFDDAGLIGELTISVRPLTGLLAFMAAIVPGAAARRSPALGVVLGVIARSLVPLFELADRAAVALLRDAWS